jgi:putative ABC transport system permease protein
VILRYVLRNFARRKTRAAMGVLGVFCTLALLTAVHVGLESVAVSYVDLVSLQAGKADLLVRRSGTDWFRPESFTESEVLTKIGSHPLLRGLSPRLAGVVPVTDGGEVRFALAVGIDPARERELGIDGFTPWPALGPDSCALSESLAGRIKADTVTVGSTELRRSGTIKSQLVFPQHIRDYVVMDLAAARRALDVPKGVHALAGAFRDPKSFYDARDLRRSVQAIKDAGEGIAEKLGPDYAVSLPKAEAITAFQAVSGPLRAVFGIFAIVALAITAILVYSLVSVSAEERTREHAILRTLGAKRRHIFGMVLAESAALCLLGVVPGTLCGAALARAVLALVGMAMGGGAGAISLEFSGSTLRLCLGAGAVVAIGSALFPALRSTRRRIVDALDPLRRGQIAEPPAGERGVSRPLLLGGLALSAISGVVFFLLPGAVVSGDPSLIGAVALGLLALLLVGLAMIAAAAAPLVEKLVLAVGGGLFGPSAELAGRNLARHRRRNATTSLMFALSVSFVLFLASLVALFSRTALSFIDRKVGADLRITPGDAREPGFDEALREIEGVQRSATATVLRGRSEEGIAYDVIASDLVGMKHLWVIPFGVDDGLGETMFLQEAQFEEGDAGAFRRLAEDNGTAGDFPPAIVSLSMARHLDVRKRDLLQLTFHLGSKRLKERVRVEAVCSGMPGFHQAFRAREGNAQGSGLLLSARTFERLTKEAPREAFHGFTLVRVKGSAREVASRVRERLGLKYHLGVECAEEEKREAEVLYWATQVLFAMLLGVAVAIALFGLVASMATAAIERRWEIGVLKAMGLRQGHLYRMFAAEAVTLTVSSGLLGGGMGFLLAYLFVAQAAILMEMPIVFTMPWITFAATFAVCAAAGLVASWFPTWRLLGRPVAEILRGA